MFQPTTACNDNGSFFGRRGHAAPLDLRVCAHCERSGRADLPELRCARRVPHLLPRACLGSGPSSPRSRSLSAPERDSASPASRLSGRARGVSNDGIRCLAAVIEGVGLETERELTPCTVRRPDFIRSPRRLSSNEGWRGQAFSLREFGRAFARLVVAVRLAFRRPATSPMHATHGPATNGWAQRLGSERRTGTERRQRLRALKRPSRGETCAASDFKTWMLKSTHQSVRRESVSRLHAEHRPHRPLFVKLGQP